MGFFYCWGFLSVEICTMKSLTFNPCVFECAFYQMDFAGFTCRNILECPTTNIIRYKRHGILNYVSKCFTKTCKEGGRDNLETSRISQSFMQRLKKKIKKHKYPIFFLH